MTVLVNLVFPIKPEKLDSFLAMMSEALKETRAFDGCISVKTYHEEDSSNVLLIEEWESFEKQKSYLNWRVETGLMDVLAEYISGELSVKKYLPKENV
jgi:quinol monooxygenase YgiN